MFVIIGRQRVNVSFFSLCRCCDCWRLSSCREGDGPLCGPDFRSGTDLLCGGDFLLAGFSHTLALSLGSNVNLSETLPRKGQRGQQTQQAPCKWKPPICFAGYLQFISPKVVQENTRWTCPAHWSSLIHYWCFFIRCF